MAEIREIRPGDEPALLKLLYALDEETRFLLLEPGERKTTVEDIERAVKGYPDSKNCMTFVAVEGEDIVGYLKTVGRSCERCRHATHIVIGILQNYTGQGIGSGLFRATENWARKNGLHRLELTVLEHNTIAMGLYKKMGFEVEGRKKQTFKIDGRFYDEICMYKFLNQDSQGET